MSFGLRIVLIIVSAAVLFYVLYKIRRAKLNISDSIFWIVLGIILLLLAIFPGISSFFATLLGIQTPLNFLLILFIAVLLLKVFLMSIHVSQQNEQIKKLAQKIAYDKFESELEKQNEHKS